MLLYPTLLSPTPLFLPSCPPAPCSPAALANPVAEPVLLRVAQHFVSLPAMADRRLPNDTIVSLGVLPDGVNPHRRPADVARRIASAVMSLSLCHGNGSAIDVSGLPSNQAINFTLPLDGSAVSRGMALACSWWSEATSDWSDAGCTALAVDWTNMQLSCSCTHLTDFAATAKPAAASPASSNAAVIGGAVGGVLGAMAVAGLVVGFVVLKKRRAARRTMLVTMRASAAAPQQFDVEAQAAMGSASHSNAVQAQGRWNAAPTASTA